MSKSQLMVFVHWRVMPYGICYGILDLTPSVLKCPKHHIFKNKMRFLERNCAITSYLFRTIVRKALKPVGTGV